MHNRSVSRPFILVLVATLVFLLFVFSTDNYGFVRKDDWKRKSVPQFDLSDYIIKTHKGFVSMKELNDNVYKKFGYEIAHPTFPVPTLRMINEPTCDVVFSEWLRISKELQPADPPKEIPDESFTLYGYSALNSWYINDKSSSKGGEKPRKWDILSELITWPKRRLGGLAYGTDGESMYNAMKAHKLDGMNGVVVGSMQPWVEVSALVHGAKHVLTVEYNNLTIQKEFQDRMASILTVDFVKDWEKYVGTFDFAASFSSIEHSGLGRYGDPIDPIGDIREMLKIKCILKKGGLLFLGFPLGTDAISYNAHRIYGPVRLALMFYGFEWIDTFSGESEEPFDLNSARFHERQLFQHSQQTLVLRKL